MVVEVVPSPHGVTLHVRGELDIATTLELEGAIHQATAHDHHRDVDLDLSAVSFVDCAGLRALLWSIGSARRQGRHLAVRRSSPAVARLSEALGAGRGLLAA